MTNKSKPEGMQGRKVVGPGSNCPVQNLLSDKLCITRRPQRDCGIMLDRSGLYEESLY